MAENKGLIADVRPGAVEVTGQQRELFPFDAFRYRNADLQPGEQDTESIYSDDTEPALDMNDPFSLNMRGRNSKANVRSIRVSEILGPDVVDQAIPDVSDFDLDATFENDEIWNAGNAEGFEFDDVAGDERGEYDAPIGAIAIKSPVLLTGGLYIDDDETKLRLTSTSFKLGSISEDGTTGTGFIYDYDADTMKYSGELEAATGTFSGELSGGSIDIGEGAFTVNSSGVVTGSDINISGGSVTGGTIDIGSGSFSVNSLGNVTIGSGGFFNVNGNAIVNGDLEVKSGGQLKTSKLSGSAGIRNLRQFYWSALTAKSVVYSAMTNDLFLSDTDNRGAIGRHGQKEITRIKKELTQILLVDNGQGVTLVIQASGGGSMGATGGVWVID